MNVEPGAAGPAGPPGFDAGSRPRSSAVAAGMASVVLVYGMGPPVMKLVSAPPLVSAAWRAGLSIPVVLVAGYVSGRRLSWSILRRTWAPGLFWGISQVMIFASLARISVATLAVIQALQPAVLLVVAGRWLGERVTRGHVAFTVVAVFGVAIVVMGGDPEVRAGAAGLLVGASAMLSYATYHTLTRRARFFGHFDPLEWTLGVIVIAGVVVVPVALAASSADDFAQFGGADWFYIAYVVVMVGVVSNLTMSWVHRFVPASQSSLYLLGMNVVAIAGGWLFHGEAMTIWQGLGCVLVLGAVAGVVGRTDNVVVKLATDSGS